MSRPKNGWKMIFVPEWDEISGNYFAAESIQPHGTAQLRHSRNSTTVEVKVDLPTLREGMDTADALLQFLEDHFQPSETEDE